MNGTLVSSGGLRMRVRSRGAWCEGRGLGLELGSVVEPMQGPFGPKAMVLVQVLLGPCGRQGTRLRGGADLAVGHALVREGGSVREGWG